MKLKQRTLIFGGLLVALLYLFAPQHLGKGRLGGDDVSYLSHALTIGLDFDLDYSNEPVVGHCMNPAGTVPCHPVGPGLMAAPFVFVLSAVDRLLDAPVLQDHLQYQFSWSYFGLLLAACVYFIGGVLLYLRAAKQIAPGLSRIAVLVFVLGFGLLHYVVQRFTMGHAYEFFSLALVTTGACLVWNAERRGKREWTGYIMITAGVPLTILVRPADITVLMLPLFVFALLDLVAPARQAGRWHIQVWLRLALAVCVGMLVVFAVSLQLYGKFWASSKDMYGDITRMPTLESWSDYIDLAVRLIGDSPNLLKVVFGSEFGLLYSSPILIVGLVALVVVTVKRWRENRRGAMTVLVLAAIYIAPAVALVLIWKSAASAYGFRYLFCLFPVALLGYAAFYADFCMNRIWGLEKMARVGHIAVIVLSCYGIIGQMLFGGGPELKLRKQVNTFGVESSYSANGYTIALAKGLASGTVWARSAKVARFYSQQRDVMPISTFVQVSIILVLMGGWFYWYIFIGYR